MRIFIFYSSFVFYFLISNNFSFFIPHLFHHFGTHFAQFFFVFVMLFTFNSPFKNTNFFFRSVLSCLILSMKSNKICNFFCWLNRDGQNTYLYIVLLLCMCGDILDHLRILQTIMQRDVSGMEEKSLNLSCLGKSGTKLTTNGQTKQRFFKIKWKETKNEIKTNSQKVFRVKYFIRTFGIDERRWTIFNSQICNRSMTMANKFFFSFDTFTRIWELRLNYRTVQHLIT